MAFPRRPMFLVGRRTFAAIMEIIQIWEKKIITDTNTSSPVYGLLSGFEANKLAQIERIAPPRISESIVVNNRVYKIENVIYSLDGPIVVEVKLAGNDIPSIPEAITSLHEDEYLVKRIQWDANTGKFASVRDNRRR